MGRYGPRDALDPSLDVLLDLANADRHGVYVSVAALNAIDWMDEKAAHRAEAIQALPLEHPSVDRRMRNYIPRLVEKILADF